MRVAKAITTAVLAGCIACTSGCGQSERDTVRAKVQQFLDATRSKDYKTLCEQVLAPALIERLVAAGLQCEQAMQIALGGVKNPTLLIGRVTVSGDHASAITLSGARHQEGSLDAVQLIKTSAGWRIASLGSPVTGGGTKR
jgi:ketosteroid isomerase-like protein